jgi:hypothetical protein
VITSHVLRAAGSRSRMHWMSERARVNMAARVFAYAL